jgi:hypothetical protein
MKKDNCKNLLEAIKDRKPLIMDLGDDVLLHMKWDKDRITPDGIKGCYVDEMGMTSMRLIQDVLNEKVYEKNYRVEIREDL